VVPFESPEGKTNHKATTGRKGTVSGAEKNEMKRDILGATSIIKGSQGV